MEQDEAGTLAALKARRREVLEPLIARHHGRIFKITGDGALAEFGSAVDAVECAVDSRKRWLGERRLPDKRRIVLRIGINLGDVIVEGGDIYGDGVNIATRLKAGRARRHPHLGHRLRSRQEQARTGLNTWASSG